MSLKKLLNKAADMFVPKEIAPFLGPASMMFAGPLGMPLALALGQAGSAKMYGGKLDPYTALGTIASAQGYKARNPTGYGRIGSGLKQGLGTFLPGGASPMDFGTEFMKGYKKPSYYFGEGTGEVTPMQRPDQVTPTDELISPDQVTPMQRPDQDKGFFNKIDEFTQGLGESMFPGFTDEDGDFDFTKALTTIGMTTTLSQMLPLAEKLKREKIEDEKKQAAIWKKWFDGYENISGIAYIDSPYPDANLIQKYKRFMMATGGRVGYNMGGATGIIAAAPGMPEGMQIDGRDGMFISQGVEEKADDVPAMLSKNEFVLTADAMKGFDKMSGGNGDPRAAAQKMYQMMNQMEAMA
tara:strand:+ start:214 stop:1272 length:1059 start_codon:yes stop_codon:yes gene_type:complete